MHADTIRFTRAMLGAHGEIYETAAQAVLRAEPGKALRLTALELAALSRAVAVAGMQHFAAAADVHELTDEQLPLAERAPALERWRQQVLATPRRTALERAAAYELTGLEALAVGDVDAARAAFREAERCLAPAIRLARQGAA